VVQGEREEIPAGTPDWYSDLIQACWAGDPLQRPDIAAIVRCLEKGYADEKARVSGVNSEVTPVPTASAVPGYLSGIQGGYLSGGNAPASQNIPSYISGGHSQGSGLNLFGAHVSQASNDLPSDERVRRDHLSPGQS